MALTDRSDALRRMPKHAWLKWAALGHPETPADVLVMLTQARRAYLDAFAAWRLFTLLDPGFREAKALCDKHSRTVSELVQIAGALGATVLEVNAALAAATPSDT